ncbi:hypothetical protein RJ639_027701 [Escallonia herrerae]|uniref:ELMO domain-containing protein n=1 Tax=Escallonia herrerae TaxID=1293975 RepID=A0AA89BK68_9ASTE|nr:hypothetical protein RJ639_027701 [Escallonia herrerae]
MLHHSSFFTLFSSFLERGPNKILTGTSTRIPRFICHKRLSARFLAFMQVYAVDEDEIYWKCQKGDEELAWPHNSVRVTSHFTQCFTTVVLLGHDVNDPYYRCVYVLCEIFYSNCVLVDVANAMVGPRSWIAGIFSRSGNKRFGSEKYIDYPFSSFQMHYYSFWLSFLLTNCFVIIHHHQQQALKALWIAAYPDITLKGLISEQWKDMGWQGPNPSTDFRYCSANFYDLFGARGLATPYIPNKFRHRFDLAEGIELSKLRGCGVLSLENLLFFARTYPASFHRLLFKQGGKRAAWEYPFAVAGINVTYMLIQMLDLYSAKPRSLPGVNFVKLLGEDEESFDVLYCIAFAMMDAQWLAMRASYMEFNVLPPPCLALSLCPFHFQEHVLSSNIGKSFRSQLRIPENKCINRVLHTYNTDPTGTYFLQEVLQVTRTQLERELSLEDLHRIYDLPAYNLLYQ